MRGEVRIIQLVSAIVRMTQVIESAKLSIEHRNGPGTVVMISLANRYIDPHLPPVVRSISLEFRRRFPGLTPRHLDPPYCCHARSKPSHVPRLPLLDGLLAFAYRHKVHCHPELDCPPGPQTRPFEATAARRWIQLFTLRAEEAGTQIPLLVKSNTSQQELLLSEK